MEKADTFRGGGYPIDIRDTAVQVTDRMGITERLRAAHVDTRRISFYNETGRRVSSLRPGSITGGVEGRDIEVPRDTLAKALTDLLRDDMEVIFDDSVSTLDEQRDHVDITLAGGSRREFGLVLGADGLHSNIRNLAFGPERRYQRDLGYRFAGFSVPNDLGLAHEALMWNAAGRAASLLCPADSDNLHGFLLFRSDEPRTREYLDSTTMRRAVADVFSGADWHVPLMVDAMYMAEDLFFDVVGQIHMTSWARGRVALAGDAAHATSFLPGLGSSVALAGAYILAGELASQSDHTEAFAAYERLARPFAELSQALAGDGKRTLVPATRRQLWIRNQALRVAPLLARTGLVGGRGRTANTVVRLPTYPR